MTTLRLQNQTSSPSDFGLPGGAPISNIHSILSDIDTVLGVNHPPALEFIFIEPYSSLSIHFFGISLNPYGHTALRWTLPDGTQRLMNVTRPIGQQPMVEIIDPAQYLFGTDNWHDQGGLYNRSMVSVRIEHLPVDSILAIDRYAASLMAHSSVHKARYHALLNNLNNFASYLVSHGILRNLEYGNCAWWISKALVSAGIMSHPIMFPKAVWVSLFENEELRHYTHDNCLIDGGSRHVQPQQNRKRRLLVFRSIYDGLNKSPKVRYLSRLVRKGQSLLSRSLGIGRATIVTADDNDEDEDSNGCIGVDIGLNQSIQNQKQNENENEGYEQFLRRAAHHVFNLRWMKKHAPCSTDSNVHVVSYREIGHAQRTYGFRNTGPLVGVAPGTIIDDFAYLNLDRLKHAEVSVPRDSISAVVRRTIPHPPPLLARARQYLRGSFDLNVSMQSQLPLVPSIDARLTFQRGKVVGIGAGLAIGAGIACWYLKK